MDSIKNVNPDKLIWIGYSGMFFFATIANSPVEICGALVLAAWILSGKFVSDTREWLRTAPALPVAGMILLPWIGLIYTPTPSDGLRMASRGYYWLYAIPLAGVLKTEKRPDLLVKLFLAGLFLNSIASLLQIAGVLPLKYGTPSGLLGISSPWITYSLLLTVGIFIASFYFQKARSRKERFLFFLLIMLYFVAIGFIGGRSGYVALIILSPLLVYTIIGKMQIFKIFVLSIITVSLLFTFPVVQSRFAQVKKDLSAYKGGNVNTSIGLRFHMWDIAVSEISEKPFWGIGTAGFKKSWELKKNDGSLPFFDHPHNSFLYMAVSFGLPGLIVFCWLIYVMLSRGRKTFDSPLGFSLFTFTLVLVIGSLTDTQILPFPSAILFSLFAGISGALDGK